MSVQNLDKNDLVIYIDKANQVSTVPKGWKRKLLENNKIIYITPSQQVISSIEQLKTYLLSDKTCKCNLICPMYLNEIFNFDPQVETVEDLIDETKLKCKHSLKLNTTSTTSTVNRIHQSVNNPTEPITIQSILNYKQTENGQIFGYIGISKDNLNSLNLSNLNLLNQPVILTSPIKTTDQSNDPTQVLQILNSSMLQQLNHTNSSSNLK